MVCDGREDVVMEATSDVLNDREELLRLSKQERNVKQKNRYDVVLLFLEGHSRREISQVLHIPSRTVSSHIAAYQKSGISSLSIKKQPGRKKKLTDAQEQELKETISTQTPEKAGLGIFANWTAPLACQLVEQRYQVKFSERGIRNLFYRIGLSYTRPTYTLDKAAPKKQEEFRQEFDMVKKTLDGGD
jgi:putative transposase